MTTQRDQNRAELADAAAIILNDATRSVDEPSETDSDLAALIGRMIQRHASEQEWMRLAHSFAAAATMATAAELRHSIATGGEAGSGVTLLVKLRDPDRS